MKRIIDGKLYDTDTATLVGEYCFGECDDSEHWSEQLYRKKTGEWFLYGEGGSLSFYSVCCGQDNFRGSSEIIPYTDDGAKEWLAQYDYVDEYIEYFGKPQE